MSGWNPNQGGWGQQPHQHHQYNAHHNNAAGGYYINPHHHHSHGGAGAFQQQHHHHGGFPQQQPFYPAGFQHHHHHHQHQFLAHHQQQQQQWQPQQQQQAPAPARGGFSAGAAEFVPGGWAPSAASAAPFVPKPAEPEPPKPSAADLAKLQAGGAAANVPIPKKTGKAKVLSFGAKKPEESAPPASAGAEKTEETSSTPATPVAPSEQQDKKADGAAAAVVGSDEKEGSAAAAAAASADKANKPRPKPKGKLNKLRNKEYIRDPRPHFSVVFCGHVDSGKSTCSGHMLADFGLVDEREMDKLRKEAEANHREGWEYAYVMDISAEEKAKGKTHETGAAYLETEHRRVTILDAPGHNAFVGSMIGGAAQADIVVMIISAKTGEFESGFNKGGQTREHAMLCRSCGVRHMIVAINKMDDCNWDKERYDKIVSEVQPFFKQNGYNIGDGKTATVMPIAGLSGLGLTKELPKEVCSWYNGPSLIGYINSLQLPSARGEDDELCVPLVGAYKDEFGKTFIYGKVESGNVVIGDQLSILPGGKMCEVEGIQVESTELEKAYTNDNVHLRVKGLDENEIHAGFVATTPDSKMRAVEYVQAKVVVLDSRNVFSAGSKAIMHVHQSAEEVTIHSILAQLDRKTMKPIGPATFIRPGEAMLVRLEFAIPIVVDEQTKFDKLGRFVLRQDSKTVALGLITKLYESTKADVEKKEGGTAADGAAQAASVGGGGQGAPPTRAAAASSGN